VFNLYGLINLAKALLGQPVGESCALRASSPCAQSGRKSKSSDTPLAANGASRGHHSDFDAGVGGVSRLLVRSKDERTTAFALQNQAGSSPPTNHRAVAPRPWRYRAKPGLWGNFPRLWRGARCGLRAAQPSLRWLVGGSRRRPRARRHSSLTLLPPRATDAPREATKRHNYEGSSGQLCNYRSPHCANFQLETHYTTSYHDPRTTLIYANRHLCPADIRHFSNRLVCRQGSAIACSASRLTRLGHTARR
jgi:hypothetical protein